MCRHVTERRAACRYDAVSNSAQLGWHTGPEFQSAPAVLKNISLVGALLQVNARIRVGESVWVRLSAEETNEWVRAVVVERERIRWGRFLLRVQFADALAHRLMESAITSFVRFAPVHQHVSEEFDNRYWR